MEPNLWCGCKISVKLRRSWGTWWERTHRAGTASRWVAHWDGIEGGNDRAAQRILVTGATGFLGGAVARELHRQGHAVRATGRKVALGAGLEKEGIAFRPGDLAADAEAVERMVKGCDAVVHAAALSKPGHRV